MEKAVYRMHNLWRVGLSILLILSNVRCGGPTGSEDNPVLAVTPEVLDFGTDRNSLTLTISNAGTGILDWQIQVPSEGWVSVNQASGTVVNTPVNIDVRVNREKAPAGEQEVKLVVTGGDGSRREVIIRLDNRQVARLSLSPTSLSFGQTSTSQQVTLRNDGGQPMTWNATTAQTWITIAPASGTMQPGDQQTVTVTISRQGQPPGTIQGTVDFTSSGGSESVNVQATVPNLPIPSISPATLDFGAVETRGSVELRNIGSATLEWTLEISDAWIRLTRTSGSVLVGDAQVIFIEVDRSGLDPGAYQGRVTLRSAGGDLEVKIAMRVVDQPVLKLSDEQLDLGAKESFTFSILNSGSGSLNWQISENAPWLELSPLSGTTSTVPQTITGTIKRSGLVAGAYETTLRVESDGGSKSIALRMEVPQPGVQITQGPTEGEKTALDRVTFAFRAVNAAGQIEYSTKLDEGEWSVWGKTTEVSYQNLEESSLVGPHLFQVRVRADAGEGETLLRRFEVDAIQGPALRLSPKAVTAGRSQTVEIEVVAEEVESLLAAHIVLSFDAGRLELQRVEAAEDFLEQHGGTVVLPEPEIDNTKGRLDLSVGVAGGSAAGVGGTGVLAKLYFRTKSSGVAPLTLGPETSLRDLDNKPVPIKTLGTGVTVQ